MVDWRVGLLNVRTGVYYLSLERGDIFLHQVIFCHQAIFLYQAIGTAAAPPAG